MINDLGWGKRKKSRTPGAAKGSLAKIKLKLTKLAGILMNSRKKLARLKARLRTPQQKKKYTLLAKKQIKLEKSTKSHAKKYRSLASSVNKLKKMTAGLSKGARKTAGRVLRSARRPFKKRRSRSLKGLDSDSLDDLGVAPLVAAGVVAAIAALLASVGALVNKASYLEEQIDALNDEIDQYEEEQDYDQDYGYEEEPADDYDDYYEEDEEDW